MNGMGFFNPFGTSSSGGGGGGPVDAYTKAQTDRLLSVKQNIKEGYGLSQENYTPEEKEKLTGIENGANNYILPNASAQTLGGIKIGEGLQIDGNGVLSTVDGPQYELPIASNETLGGIKVGEGLEINENGILSTVENPQYELPIASDKVLGGIKVGEGLQIDNEGVLSAYNYEEGEGIDITATESTIDMITNVTWEQGSISNGVENYSATRIRTHEYISIDDIDYSDTGKIYLKAKTVNNIELDWAIEGYDLNKQCIYDGSWINYSDSDNGLTSTWKYVRFVLKKPNSENFTPEELGEAFIVRFHGLENKIISVAPATNQTLGGVKEGSGVTIGLDGTISAAIPNNARLEIQKNGSTIGSFSADASTDQIINITIPDALPSNTKYGSSLDLSINSSTFVITAILKDQNGDTLGTTQTIDLPLESVVVNGAYDDTTKKVILTLQNGSTVEFSVADLVAGLQSEITSESPLDADLVDDSTSTNKFVTAADKTAWNAKSDFSGSYNDLTDKPTIPAAQVNADWSAQSGVAAILNKPTIPTVDQIYSASSTNAQSGTAVASAISGKQDEITSSAKLPADLVDDTNSTHKFVSASEKSTWNGKQEALSQSQLAAVNSGITAAKLTADEAALAEVINAGAKNKLKNVATSTTIGEVVYTVNADGSVTVYTNGTVTETRSLSIATTVNNVQVDINDVISGIPPTGDFSIGYGIGTSGNNFVIDSNNPTRIITVSGVLRYCSLNARAGVNIPQADAVTFYPMICTKAEWDISQAYIPYAKTNRELTVAEDEDRAALIGQVDGETKNRFLYDKAVGTTETIHGRTFTIQPDGGVKVETTGTVDADADFYLLGVWSNTSVLFDTGSRTWIPVCSCTTKSDNISLRIYNRSTGSTVASRTTTSNDNAGLPFDFDLTCAFIKIGANQTIPTGGIIVYPMICSAVDYAISPVFVPYADTNPVLTQEVNWNVNQGVKNLIKLNPNTYTSGNVVVKLNDDGTISVSLSSGSTANTIFSRAVMAITNLRDMDLILNGCPSGGNYSSGYALYISDDGVTKEKDEGNGVLVPKNTTVTTSYLALIVRSGTAISGTLTFKPMIRPASITDATFQPYALPNPVLTPALIEQVDAGAKNMLKNINSAGSQTIRTLTFTTDSQGCVTISSGTASDGNADLHINSNAEANLVVGQTYILTGCPSGGSLSGYRLNISSKGSDIGEGLEFTYDGSPIDVYIRVSSGYQLANAVTFKPMICTLTDYAISQAFVPYRPSWQEMYEMIQARSLNAIFGLGVSIPSNSDLNNYRTGGIFYVVNNAVASTISNIPVDGSGFKLIVRILTSPTYCRQEFYKSTQPNTLYVRYYTGSWSSWYKFEGTEVIPASQ